MAHTSDGQTAKKTWSNGRYAIRTSGNPWKKKGITSRRKKFAKAVQEAQLGIPVDEDGHALNRILCTDTGEVFDSISDVRKKYPAISAAALNRALKTKNAISRDYTRSDGTKVTYIRTGVAGWDPETGQDLHWKRVV